ncbi:MAG: ATP synthase gamma chain [uncultured bacterium]|uniref:ATP synthase gamma chain n=4 Tax=Candidatus Daviesiibacteriota TaxID=1752718 RepID=A0A0G0I330_9BACT|nr:MAG: ATP synthase gamma chain [uncultured bacterium]KKQ10516.1 MAG: ATP synthase gamma chain [Candidatus Daviesbacteria bacterium GW2011_GWB1_36_5]KKQ14940.1 MAG: ATP synthase gamma chain [Candidatus Daviesbacteria bacterium GW2011_GWA1_36_8]OGE17223.1 MAG: ATP synthase F1 subunit gamma [Candidatus Daviesbacteria bacterium RIFCSPHIGHO2_01_FULL_36_37]OGE36003.1 MAG: ATP synthase F1 subunit gamma [Candidatus Daviesbacteria bacterium RIFCSPHIGHO2_12_FULL_37_16]
MANTRELRRRIKSVKNTAQITKAMQMVAATKMRRAQSQALSGRPYSQTLNQALTQLLPRIESGLHPLLQSNDASKNGIILLSTDKGLAGALNTNLFRAALNFSKDHKDIDFFTQGKKARQFAAKLGKNLVADFENPDTVTFRQAIQISKVVVDPFLKGELKEVYLIYPDFVSTLRQEPKVIKLLPIDIEALKSFINIQLENTAHPRGESKVISKDHLGGGHQDFLFEPNLNDLLDFILIHFIQTKIYQALLETKASEHSARMMAMQNATENAKELVGDLTLSYNQTRQESITRELLEITSALAALE